MNKNIIIIISILILSLSFIGCDKYHRNRYTGNWDFVTYRYTSIETDSAKSGKYDTIYYSGKISLGDIEDRIIIQYTENDKIAAWLDQEGYIFNSTQQYGGKSPFGKFDSKDKIDFNIRVESYWGEKPYIIKSERVNGTKKKGGKNG